MKMKKRQKTFKAVVVLYYGALITFFLILIGGLLYLFFDDVGNCLDADGIYDHNRKECRYDCLKWTKEEGCIPLPDDYEMRK